MTQWRQNLERYVKQVSYSAANRMGKNYVAATQKVLSDEKLWKDFANSVTRRKNPRAPTPVAVGPIRDTIDTYEMHDSVYFLTKKLTGPGYSVDIVIERDRLDFILERRPELWDYVLEEEHLLDAYGRE